MRWCRTLDGAIQLFGSEGVAEARSAHGRCQSQEADLVCSLPREHLGLHVAVGRLREEPCYVLGLWDNEGDGTWGVEIESRNLTDIRISEPNEYGNYCGANFHGWACTRRRGHDEYHVAGLVGGRACAIWDGGPDPEE